MLIEEVLKMATSKAKKNGRATSDYEFGELVGNVLMSRQELVKAFLDPRRDIDDECGYPKTNGITGDKYRMLYDREPVAARVVEVMPRESWQTQPSVFESEDAETETPFEVAWRELDNNLRGESWYHDEEGSPIWEHLRRTDELSGIGKYGVLLLGFDDGQQFIRPVERREGMKLLYLRSFDEALAEVARYEDDIKSPRFGQPTEYNITFNDPRDQSQSGVGLPLSTMPVHWSRVVHIADNLGSSEIFGTPRMQPVYNRLWDLRKLYGGSAEMYWRGAFPGLALETHPQLGGDVALDKSSIRDEMENYMTGLQRYLALMGMTAKSLAPQVVDPSPQIDVQITAICIKLGIPKRIFMGSERGELSSSQDAGTWNARIRDRQRSYLTPRIIVPFVDRMIATGVLPEPESYSVVWPDLESLTEEEQAIVAVRRTEAMAKYVGGSVESLMTPMDYFTRVLGLTSEAAEAVLESTMGALEDEEPDDDELEDDEFQEEEEEEEENEEEEEEEEEQQAG
jgi:hypothetical protein